jgi:hypothetical protein
MLLKHYIINLINIYQIRFYPDPINLGFLNYLRSLYIGLPDQDWSAFQKKKPDLFEFFFLFCFRLLSSIDNELGVLNLLG